MKVTDSELCDFDYDDIHGVVCTVSVGLLIQYFIVNFRLIFFVNMEHYVTPTNVRKLMCCGSVWRFKHTCLCHQKVW